MSGNLNLLLYKNNLHTHEIVHCKNDCVEVQREVIPGSTLYCHALCSLASKEGLRFSLVHPHVSNKEIDKKPSSFYCSFFTL